MFRSQYSILLVGLLSACGGGGNSSSNENTNTNSQNTFSVQVVYKDACSNETAATDAAVLIHNSDYSNKTTLYADENGRITYQSEDSEVSLSVIARGQSDVNGIKPIAVTTYVAHPMLDKGKFIHYTYETGQCECNTASFDVYVPSRPGEKASSSIYGYNSRGSLSEQYSYTSVSNYEFCKPITGDWPLMSFSSTFKYANESYGLLTNDLFLPSYDATITGTKVDISTNAPNRQVLSFIDGKFHFANYSYFENTPLFGFDTEQTEFYRIHSYDFIDIYDVPDIDNAYLFTLSTINTQDISQPFDIALPSIDYIRLFDIILSESGHYDLSDIQGLDYISTSIRGYHYAELVFDWYMMAPVQGQVPNIENIDISEFISDGELENSITTLRINASATNYEGINDYQDHQRKVIDRELEDFILPEWNKQQRYSFNITTSDVEFKNMTSIMPTKTQLKTLMIKENQKSIMVDKNSAN